MTTDATANTTSEHADVLLFRLFGPLASWGEIAVGEIRPSAPRPTRSALLGLIAAALGIDRQNDEGHVALRDGLCLATRVDNPGLPLVDYHTLNWRQPKRKERFLTRADTLRTHRNELQTVQSTRHYYCDAFMTVAAVGTTTTPTDGGASLTALRHALEQPRYPLSLGRKACPPALPLTPRIVRATALLDAFTRYDAEMADADVSALPRALRRAHRRGSLIEVAWDENLPLTVDIEPELIRIEQRRDEPTSRRRWRFATRGEAVAAVDPTTFSKHDTAKESSHVSESSEPA